MKMKLSLMATCVALAWNAPVLAQDSGKIDRLEQQIKQLTEEMKQIKDAQAADKKENVVKGDTDGSFRVPGSDTSIRLYGFLEAQATYDIKGNQNASCYDFALCLAYAPLKDSGDDKRKGNFDLTARTSRLGVEATRPTAWGLASGKLEFDFATYGRTDATPSDDDGAQGYTNAFRPRLRHAYISVGPWLFGQTWSTFMDADYGPETLDFNGPIASPFIRQAMIRYTFSAGDAGSFTVAAENGRSDAAGGTNYNTRPDLIARWDYSADWGGVNVRLLSNQYKVKNDAGVSASKAGNGFGISGMFKLSDNDALFAQYTDGTGLGRYMQTFNVGAVYDATNNKILFEKGYGFVLGYQHKFADNLRTNISYNTQKTKEDAAIGFTSTGAYSGANKKLDIWFANVIWSPLKDIELGLEYAAGKRKTFDNQEGNLSRITGSAKMYF